MWSAYLLGAALVGPHCRANIQQYCLIHIHPTAIPPIMEIISLGFLFSVALMDIKLKKPLAAPALWMTRNAAHHNEIPSPLNDSYRIPVQSHFENCTVDHAVFWLIRQIPHLLTASLSAIVLHNDKQQLCGWSCLTLLVGREKDAEATLAARLIRPHSDDAECGDQHDVVGHRGAELALQVLHRTEKDKVKNILDLASTTFDICFVKKRQNIP